MEQGYAGSLLKIGTGQDVTIRELAETIMNVVGFEKELCLMRVSRMGCESLECSKL